MPSNNDKKKYNATCSICGKPYNMCYSCDKKNAQLVWKRFCDTPEHYKIYQLVHGYTTGLYTKAEAKRKLKNIDTSDIDELRPNIREILVGIMGNDKKVEPVVEDTAESVDVESSVEPVEPIETEESSVEPSRRTRKRTTVKTEPESESESKESEVAEA